MRGRSREAPTESATTRYRGTDGRWHARVTVGRRLDGARDRRHISLEPPSRARATLLATRSATPSDVSRRRGRTL